MNIKINDLIAPKAHQHFNHTEEINVNGIKIQHTKQHGDNFNTEVLNVCKEECIVI